MENKELDFQKVNKNRNIHMDVATKLKNYNQLKVE